MYSTVLPQNTEVNHADNPALTKDSPKIANNIPVINNNGGIPTWSVQNQPALSGSDESQAAKQAKKPIERGALNINDRQKIDWKIKPDSTYSSFVVDDGTQLTLTNAKPKPKTELIFGNEEGEVQG